MNPIQNVESKVACNNKLGGSESKINQLVKLLLGKNKQFYPSEVIVPLFISEVSFLMFKNINSVT